MTFSRVNHGLFNLKFTRETASEGAICRRLNVPSVSFFEGANLGRWGVYDPFSTLQKKGIRVLISKLD